MYLFYVDYIFLTMGLFDGNDLNNWIKKAVMEK